MAKIQDREFPEHLLYDLANQIWYEPLPDGLIRAGFTPLAMSLAGDVLVDVGVRVDQHGRFTAGF